MTPAASSSTDASSETSAVLAATASSETTIPSETTAPSETIAPLGTTGSSETSATSETAKPLQSTATPATSTSNKKPASTSDESTAEENTDSEESEKSGKPRIDRRLGIALGVVFGVIGFGLLGFILFWMHRRHKRHGGNGIFRRTPSISSEIDAWESPQQPEMGNVNHAGGPLAPGDGTGPSIAWLERFNRSSNQHTPPAHLHPAFANSRHPSDKTYNSSEDNTFFTPLERSDAQLEHHREPNDFTAVDTGYHPGYPHAEPHVTAGAAATAEGAYVAAPRRSSSENRRSSSSVRSDRDPRPPTPYSPMMMMQASSPPANRNPFASPEDDAAERRRLTDEEDDVVSPILPSRSPHRRPSPMVHYPSWSEVSEFDFTGEQDGRGRRTWDSGGEDAYGRHRDSVVGRTELA